MTLQNRVTPWGDILATPERGAWMGNRGGCFHDERQKLTPRRWISRQWITCRLEFKGWHREVMKPRQYTELFFLDEATALAAGHRPCFECRRQDALRFRDAWAEGNLQLGLGPAPRVAGMDAVLHADRLHGRTKRTFEARFADLPPGVMVAGDDGGAGLLGMESMVFPWSFGRYGPPRPTDPYAVATVLTPRSTVAAIRAGYAPQIDGSSTGDGSGRTP